MSHALYFTRLWFVYGRGIAKLHGRQVKLTAPPLEGYEEIDYTPEVHCCRIRPRFGGWRDMESDEIAAADALLWRLLPAP